MRYLIPILGAVLLIVAISIPLSGAGISAPKRSTVYSMEGEVIGYVESSDKYLTATGGLFTISLIAGIMTTVFGITHLRTKDS